MPVFHSNAKLTFLLPGPGIFKYSIINVSNAEIKINLWVVSGQNKTYINAPNLTLRVNERLEDKEITIPEGAQLRMVSTGPVDYYVTTTAINPAVVVAPPVVTPPVIVPTLTSDVLSMEAGQNLSTGVLVAALESKLFAFNPGIPAHIGTIIGVTKTSGIVGDSLSVQHRGVITDPAYSFNPDKMCFVGPGGILTTTVPTSGIIQPCGKSLTATSFLINIQLPIKK